ncbi:MAG: T9SS type A sorting domain-containing protein [Bacteroidota bacterium]
MKKISLLLFIFFTLTAKAQWVSIPDTNFGTWLNTNGYSACLQGNNGVGWQMDTTCPAVVNATYVSCSHTNISDLTGIQYFDSLKNLNCSSNSLNTLPQLPKQLNHLECSFNQLTNLSALPSNLTVLSCDYNQLTFLPSIPQTLTQLHCKNNQLTGLPGFPFSLDYLDCSENSITSIWFPNFLRTAICGHNQLASISSLPNTIVGLFCEYNQLTSLPLLPNSLTVLSCDGNLMTGLPTLPANLQRLYCNNGELTSLPTLPLSLQELNCWNNQLTSLPPLPSSLSHLNCQDNLLTSLPNLPSILSSFDCSQNQITALSSLPSSMFICNISANPLTCFPTFGTITNLDFRSTLIACLPRYTGISNCNPPIQFVPLCDPFNSNGCSSQWNITGNVFYDANNNCVKNASDVAQGNIKVQLKISGNVIQQSFTGGEGFYSFDTDSLGTYEVSVDTSNIPFYVSCPANNTHYDTLIAIDSLDYNKDFALKCKPGFDLTAHSIYGSRFRPATFTTVNIGAGDITNFYGAHCAAGVVGAVTVSFTGAVSYISPAAGALTPSIAGSTLTYTIPDFGAVNFFSHFNFLLQTDTTAPLGSQVCITVSVTPTAGDNNPANNTLTQCFTVVGSYDPNDKQVSPPSVVDTSGWLTYTINFQNTGSDTAIHIYITDTLDAGVDESTFQLLAYSMQPMVQLTGNAVRFNFPNIYLPDSNVNEPASHGYVQYKVRVKNNLVRGTQIQNTAFIYFDFNAPVVTNTVTNTIDSAAPCSPTVSNISAQICEGTTYLFNGMLLNSTGVYVDSLSDVNGCDSLIELTLTVTSPILFVTTADTLICQGQCFELGNSAGASGGTPPYTYLWSNGAFPPNVPNPTACPTMMTNYRVTVTDTMGCSASADVNVLLRTSPTADAGPGGTLVACPNDCITLGGNPTGSGTQGPYTYQWSPCIQPPSMSSCTVANPVVCNLGFSTQFCVTVTDIFGCTASDCANIQVVPNTLFFSLGNDISLCANALSCVTFNPNLSGGFPPSSCQWFINGIPVPGNSCSLTHCPTVNTTYTLVITDSRGCTFSDAIIVTVNQPPVADFIGLDSQYCITAANEVITVSCPNGVLSGPGIAGNIFSPAMAGVGGPNAICYICQDLATGCRDTVCKFVTVYPIPQVSVTGHQPSYCSYEECDTLMVSPPGGVFSPSLPGGVFCPANGVPGNNVITYNYTDSMTGCSNSTTINIIVRPEPTLNLIASDDTICSGESIVTMPNYGSDVMNISYAFLGGNTFASGLNPVIFYPTVINNCVVAAALSSSGCIAKDTVCFYVIPQLVVDSLTSVNVSCFGEHDGSACVFVSAGTQPFIYSWNNSDTGQCITGLTAGSYDVTVADVIGCTVNGSVNIIEPSAIATSLNAVICPDTSYSFNGQVIHQQGIYTDTLIAANGCDSVVTLQLEVNSAFNIHLGDTICQGDSYLFNGQNLTSAGVYEDTLVSEEGCDSIVTLNLTVLVCSGIEQVSAQKEILLYPNPATNSITISVDKNLIGSSAIIYDVTGRKMIQLNIGHRITNVETENFSSGVYILDITIKDISLRRRWVKM